MSESDYYCEARWAEAQQAVHVKMSGRRPQSAPTVIRFSDVQDRLVLHPLLIGVFMFVTTPVTYMMLVRAALHRDAAEGRDLLASRHRPGPPGAPSEEGQG